MISRVALILPVAAFFTSCASKGPVPDVITHQGPQPVRIEARANWNDSGISLRKGRTYQFQITGTWTDWFVPAGPDGITCPLARGVMSFSRPCLRYSSRLDPGAQFFQPIGTIGRSTGRTHPSYAFIIRDGMEFNAPKSGTLHVFANDIPSEAAYSNNQGHLFLTVSETP